MKKKYILMICGSLLVASIATSAVVISKLAVNADPANQILVPEYSYFENFDAFIAEVSAFIEKLVAVFEEIAAKFETVFAFEKMYGEVSE